MYVCMYKCITYDVTITMHCTQNNYPEMDGRHRTSKSQRREIMVGVNTVGVNMAFHDAICECVEGTMLKPCFHVAELFHLWT